MVTVGISGPPNLASETSRHHDLQTPDRVVKAIRNQACLFAQRPMGLPQRRQFFLQDFAILATALCAVVDGGIKSGHGGIQAIHRRFQAGHRKDRCLCLRFGSSLRHEPHSSALIPEIKPVIDERVNTASGCRMCVSSAQDAVDFAGSSGHLRGLQANSGQCDGNRDRPHHPK
jgi:hypothetical protein